MSTKPPIFPIFEPQHFNDYDVNNFQVLQEARKHKRESKKDDSSKKIKKTKKRWWINPFLFLKSSRKQELVSRRVGSMFGPVYVTESRTRSGSWTPYRTARKPGSGPVKRGEVDMPYVSLKELNMEQHCKPAIPIYLVT